MSAEESLEEQKAENGSILVGNAGKLESTSDTEVVNVDSSKEKSTLKTTVGEKRSLSETNDETNVEESEISAESSVEPGRKRTKVEIPEGMSKNQWKKLQKRKFWESKKEELKQYRKEKKKLDKAKKHEKIEELLAQGQSIEQIREELMLKNRSSKNKTNPDQTDSKVSVIYDCGFDEMMNDREKVSLNTQICRSYGENRRAAQFINMKISSFSGPLKQRFDTKAVGYQNWKNIEYVEEGVEELIEKDKLDVSKTVYLSADEPYESIDELQEGFTYIIGGIVDKGRYKSLCYDKAKRLGLKTARLPIDEFIQIAGRQVLTTLHVFLLLSKWLEHRDWKKAFEEVLPERKQRIEGVDDEQESSSVEETKT